MSLRLKKKKLSRRLLQGSNQNTFLKVPNLCSGVRRGASSRASKPTHQHPRGSEYRYFKRGQKRGFPGAAHPKGKQSFPSSTKPKLLQLREFPALSTSPTHTLFIAHFTPL